MVRQHHGGTDEVINNWHVNNHGQKDNEPFQTVSEVVTAQRDLERWHKSVLRSTYCVTKIVEVPEPDVDYKALYEGLKSKVEGQIQVFKGAAVTNRMWAKQHNRHEEYYKAGESKSRAQTYEYVVASLEGVLA